MSKKRRPGLITGDDLVSLGYVPGPHFISVIRYIEEKLECGEIQEDQQKEYSKKYLTEQSIYPFPKPKRLSTTLFTYDKKQ